MSRDRPPPSSHSRPHRTLAAGTAAPPERSQPSGAPEASPTLPSSSCSPHPSGRQYAHPPAAPSPPRSRPLQHSPPRPWTDPDRRPPPGRLRPRPQGTAERRTHRRLYQYRPLRLTSAVHNTAPEAVGNTFHDSPDGPERHDLPRPGQHVAPAGRHTQATGHDVDRNQPDLRLRRRRMSSHYFLRRRSIDRQRKKKVWRQHNLFHQGTADDVQPHFFRGDLRADSRRNHTGRARLHRCMASVPVLDTSGRTRCWGHGIDEFQYRATPPPFLLPHHQESRIASSSTAPPPDAPCPYPLQSSSPGPGDVPRSQSGAERLRPGPQGTAEGRASRRLRRGLRRGQRIQLTHTVQVTEPNRLSVDALPLGNDMDGTECDGFQ